MGAIEAAMGEDEYAEMMRKLEHLAAFSEDLKEMPVEEREQIEPVIEEAIDLAEEVYAALDGIDEADIRWALP